MSLSSIPILNPYFDLHQLLLPLLCADPTESREIRRKLVSAYAWAVPSRAALNAIATLDLPLLELGAGTGYWAFCLRQLGVQIDAFDRLADAAPSWSGVEKANGLEILAERNGFSDGALLLCWPPLGEPFAADCLAAFRGSTVIEIGEDEGGNTADSAFFRSLRKDWILRQQLDLPRWPEASDSLRIWARR